MALLAFRLSLALSAEDPASLEPEIAALGSDLFAEREQAADRVRQTLAALERENQVDDLGRLLRDIRGRAARMEDPEVRGRLTGLLGPYQAGAPIWAKGAEDLPGCVQTLSLCPEGILVGGCSKQWRGWAGLYHVATGTPLWENRDLPDPIDLLQATPHGILLAKRNSRNTGLRMLDPATGKTLWHIPLPGLSSFSACPDGILVAGMEIRTDRTPDQAWLALLLVDARTGKILWEKKSDCPNSPKLLPLLPDSFLVARGALFNGQLERRDVKTGALRWSADMPGVVDAVLPMEDRVVASGYTSTIHGWVGAFDLTTGRMLWMLDKNSFNPIRTILAVDGNLLVGESPNGRMLTCRHWIVSPDGSALREIAGLRPEFPYSLRSTPAGLLADGLTLSLHDCESGKTIWNAAQHKVGPGTQCLHETFPGLVFVVTKNPGLVCMSGFDLKTGKLLWETALACSNRRACALLPMRQGALMGGGVPPGTGWLGLYRIRDAGSGAAD